MTTSGRIPGEFVSLLYILAHFCTQRYFAAFGDNEPGVDWPVRKDPSILYRGLAHPDVTLNPLYTLLQYKNILSGNPREFDEPSLGREGNRDAQVARRPGPEVPDAYMLQYSK